MNKLDQIVYCIKNGAVVESRIRDLSGYIDETTTPLGVAPRYHVRGNELWTWGTGGNNPRRVQCCATEQEAQEALDETFYQDFLRSDIVAFPTPEEASLYLSEWTGE